MSKRWYVVHVYSGMEKSVARALQERIDRAGMKDKFGKILVPTDGSAPSTAACPRSWKPWTPEMC